MLGRKTYAVQSELAVADHVRLKILFPLLPYLSILLCSSPSRTSGSQWQKQFAIKTPPPRFRRKERMTFFIFFFSLFIITGSRVSMLEKSYLKV